MNFLEGSDSGIGITSEGRTGASPPSAALRGTGVAYITGAAVVSTRQGPARDGCDKEKQNINLFVHFHALCLCPSYIYILIK